MLGQDVYLKGKHFMAMMLQEERRHQTRHAIAGQIGVAVVVVA